MIFAFVQQELTLSLVSYASHVKQMSTPAGWSLVPSLLHLDLLKFIQQLLSIFNILLNFLFYGFNLFNPISNHCGPWLAWWNNSVYKLVSIIRSHTVSNSQVSVNSQIKLPNRDFSSCSRFWPNFHEAMQVLVKSMIRNSSKRPQHSELHQTPDPIPLH